MEANKYTGTQRKNGVFTCKSNASQRCKDKIREIAKIWEDAPNASTCKDEDPQYEEVQKVAKSCTLTSD